ncbi:MAG: ROK family glucokinase [Eubacterium sp.]|nr:ROK family glucokinase [Eubacterium sp.]MBR3538677.1 ROK family glucokinase [Eubacterium sp.]
MASYVFGVDIGGTTVKIGLFSAEGELLDKWEITTRTDDGGAYILSDIADSVKAKMAERSIDKADVIGVGMGVPGPVKEDGTVIKCVNLGWGVFNAAEELSGLLDMKVKVGNDANMAALGEMWQGGGKGHENIVMVTLGTGVGGGIILGGKMLAGTNGAGGEIGHMTMDINETDVCNCGKRGCLEQYASATGIVRLANKALNDTDRPSKLREVQYISAKEIFDAAKSGDELASEQVEALGKKLGLAAAQISCVVDPEVFVIGGGVSRAGQIILDVTEKYFKQYAFHACRSTRFELAVLGNDAGMYGGARAVLG